MMAVEADHEVTGLGVDGEGDGLGILHDLGVSGARWRGER